MKFFRRLFLEVKFFFVRYHPWTVKYIKTIRKIEKILEIPECVFAYIVDIETNTPAILFKAEGKDIRYLIPSKIPQTIPSSSAIHEVRHRLQKENGVRLITEKELQNFPDFLKFIEELKFREDKEEIDAIICEKIGFLLLRTNEIEQFKELMLNSMLPAKLPDNVKIETQITAEDLKIIVTIKKPFLTEKIISTMRRTG